LVIFAIIICIKLDFAKLLILSLKSLSNIFQFSTSFCKNLFANYQKETIFAGLLKKVIPKVAQLLEHELAPKKSDTFRPWQGKLIRKRSYYTTTYIAKVAQLLEHDLAPK
jgi:hypothetical protein